MGQIFNPKTPKIPEPPKPVEPPTIDEAALAADEEERNKKRLGRTGNILTGNQGDTSRPTTGVSSILGG